MTVAMAVTRTTEIVAAQRITLSPVASAGCRTGDTARLVFIHQLPFHSKRIHQNTVPEQKETFCGDPAGTAGAAIRAAAPAVWPSQVMQPRPGAGCRRRPARQE